MDIRGSVTTLHLSTSIPTFKHMSYYHILKTDSSDDLRRGLWRTELVHEAEASGTT